MLRHPAQAAFVTCLAMGAPAMAADDTPASSSSSPTAVSTSGAEVLSTVTVSAGGVARQSLPLDYLAKDNDTGALGDKPILDTPFSVTQVSGKNIEERGAKSVGQIFRNDASVTSPALPFATNWWSTRIRGLGVHNYYVDGVPMMMTWGGSFPTEAVASITALKGLTGFMYGIGDPGGAISYRLKRPTAKPVTRLGIGYNNPGVFSLQADSSQRVGETLGVRFGVAADEGRAYDSAKTNRKVAWLAVDEQFGPVSWYVNAVYENSKLKSEPLHFYLTPGTDPDSYDAVGGGGNLPKASYDYDDYSVDNSYYDTRTWLTTTELDWRINDRWKARYQLGYSDKLHHSNKTFADLLNIKGDYAGYLYNFGGKLENLFTQAMLQGSVTTFGIEHDLVAGIGWQNRKKAYSPFYYSNDFNGNLYVDQPYRITRPPDFSTDSTHYENRRRYAFASDTVKFNEHWQLLVGLRYVRYRNKDTDGDPAVDSGFVNHALSPTYALIYKPDYNTSLYASYVEALQPGQAVSPPYLNAGKVLDPTVSRQYEIGAKQLLGRAAWSAALFRIQRANLMVQGGTPGTLTQNGQVTYDGAELNGSYRFTDNLDLGLSAMMLSASIDETDVAAIKGNTPAGAPDLQLVAFGEYRVAAVHGLALHGSVRYVGKTYVDDGNAIRAPGYPTVAAGVRYAFSAWHQRLELTANIYNLLNRKYWAVGDAGSLTPGLERSFSLGLNMRF